MKTVVTILGFLFAGSLFTNAQNISTVVGNGYGAGASFGGYTGDGGQATAAELYAPYALAFDASGNMLFTDALNNVVRKVDGTGKITTIIGNGTQGYSGDGGQATAAEMSIPFGIAIDTLGNIYVADTYNSVIRKVDGTGKITTVAGNSVWGYSGDGAAATLAELQNPMGIAFDKKGNLYIADQSNNVVRMVDGSGNINTVVGSGIVGYAGDGGAATMAEMQAPTAIAFDASGNMYIADEINRVVRKVNTSGTISTFAGKGKTTGYSGDGGPATLAEIYAPFGLAFDVNGNLYIADGNTTIRMVNKTGTISTVAGIRFQGYSGDGGPATAADLDNPTSVLFDATGNLFITDAGNNVIREVAYVPTLVPQVQTNSEVSVFPNPSRGEFHFCFSHAELVSASHPIVEVYNILGKKVYSQYSIPATQFSIDLAGQPKGIYLYRITSEDGNFNHSGKLIIE